MSWQEKRKAASIARLIEDRQLTMEEAIEAYHQSFRERGSKGGKLSTGRPFKDTPGLAKKAQEASVKSRKAK